MPKVKLNNEELIVRAKPLENKVRPLKAGEAIPKNWLVRTHRYGDGKFKKWAAAGFCTLVFGSGKNRYSKMVYFSTVQVIEKPEPADPVEPIITPKVTEL